MRLAFEKRNGLHQVHLPQRASYTSAQLGHMEDQLGSMVMLTHNDCQCLSHVQKLKWLIWVKLMPYSLTGTFITPVITNQPSFISDVPISFHTILLNPSVATHPATSPPTATSAQIGFGGIGAGARSVARETGPFWRGSVGR